MHAGMMTTVIGTQNFAHLAPKQANLSELQRFRLKIGRREKCNI